MKPNGKLKGANQCGTSLEMLLKNCEIAWRKQQKEVKRKRKTVIVWIKLNETFSRFLSFIEKSVLSSDNMLLFAILPRQMTLLKRLINAVLRWSRKKIKKNCFCRKIHLEVGGCDYLMLFEVELTALKLRWWIKEVWLEIFVNNWKFSIETFQTCFWNENWNSLSKPVLRNLLWNLCRYNK